MTEQEKEAREKEVEEWLHRITRLSAAKFKGVVIQGPYHTDDWLWDAIKNPRTRAEFTEEDTNDVPKNLTTPPQD